MYKQGDILIIPIPFSDLTSNKKRPVLVVSNSEYNNKTEDLIVMAITSNLESKDYTILFTNEDLTEGSLKLTSCIRVDKIYTLSKNIVVKKFGLVNANILEKVRFELNRLVNNHNENK